MLSFFRLAQEIPSTDKLSGDTNLIWFIGFLLFLLCAVNSFWIYRDRRVALEVIDERKEWEKKRDAFDLWKEASHKKMMKLALRVQKALEVWHGIESESDLVDEED
jgi:hypothetical protein